MFFNTNKIRQKTIYFAGNFWNAAFPSCKAMTKANIRCIEHVISMKILFFVQTAIFNVQYEKYWTKISINLTRINSVLWFVIISITTLYLQYGDKFRVNRQYAPFGISKVIFYINMSVYCTRFSLLQFSNEHC